MTLQRRNKKGLLALCAVTLLASSGMLIQSYASTSERVVVNRHTGLAIDGFDPVAYFTDQRPVQGLENVELLAKGAVWRFHTPSNRAFFAASPDIYGPQFGGYDPVDLARGVAYAGRPQHWVVYGQRLYLFGREESRDAFAAAPAQYLESAQKSWRNVEKVMAQ